MSEQEPTETAENADGANREKNIVRFEKLFRLMDSSEKGEAEAAFRSARLILPKIDLTFAQMLEMMGNSGGPNDQELLNTIEEYRVANEQLKEAEELVIAENERMNFLLRNYRDTPFIGKELNPKAFREELASLSKSFTKLNDGTAKDLPANVDELEKYYTARIAEAVEIKQGAASGNGLQRMLLWLVKKSGRDLSLDSILKAQDLVIAQQAVIKEQSDLLKEITELRATSFTINDKLDALVSAAGTPEAYAEALEHLKKAQLLLGDSQSLDAITQKNLQLEQELADLERALAAKDKDIAALSESLAAEKAKPPVHVYVDENGNLKDSSVIAQAQLALSGYAEKLSTDISTPVSPASADQIMVKTLEQEIEAQRNEVLDLQKKLVPAAIDNVLSADDTEALRKLERYVPVLEQSLQDIETIRATLENSVNEPSPGIFGFFKRRQKSRREIKKLQNSLKQLETIAESFGKARTALHALGERFDQKLDATQKKIAQDMTDRVTAENTRRQDLLDSQRKALEDNLKKLAAEYQSKLDGARKTYEDTVKKIEDSLAVDSGYFLEHQKQRLALQAEIEEGLAKHLAAKGSPADNDEARQIRQRALDDLLVKAYGDSDKMTYLLSKGANIETVFQSKQYGPSTLLRFAITTENDDMARFLVEKGADIFAVHNNQTSVEYVLSKKWEKNSKFQSILGVITAAIPATPATAVPPQRDKAQTQEALNQLMHLAYTNNDFDNFKQLVKRGADINALSTKGNTPLMRAILNKQWDWAEVVVALSPDPQTPNGSGATIYATLQQNPLQNRSDMLRAIDILNRLTPDAPAPKPVKIAYDDSMRAFANTQLVMAFNSNNIEMCKLAIAKGADINTPVNNEKQTALMVSLKNENIDMFNFAAAQKPNIMLKDSFNKTVLDYAQKNWQNSRARLAITESLLKIIPKAPGA